MFDPKHRNTLLEFLIGTEIQNSRKSCFNVERNDSNLSSSFLNHELIGDPEAFVDAACKEEHIDYFDCKAIKILAVEQV